ncbi:MAG: ABC-F family ATP-binding cassette domain-containing protein [Chlamydiales bacterium]
MIILAHLAMHYGSQLLFDDVNLNLNQGCRYGIVGANGSGKSTLLRLIAGEEEPIVGTITLSKDSLLGWLKQDQYLFENEPILDVVLRGKKLLWEVMQTKEKLLKKENWSEEDAFHLAELEEKIEKEGGYEAEAEAQTLLSGLGIDEVKHYDSLSTLSGGFKLRVLLARALFSRPDILLLDEPTNYLDVISIPWLERYLVSEYKGLLLVVSHDRGFLNTVATHILDIDYGDIRCYTGNYDRFIQKKEEVIEQKMQEKKHLDKKAARMRQFIERFKANASRSKQASSREKLLEKLKWPDIEKSSRGYPHFSFKKEQASGKIVLKGSGLSKSFGEQLLFEDLNLMIERGEKIVILGKNGSGKSTLLKILLENLSPDQGSIQWGQNVEVAYFSQNLREQLSEEATVLEWLNESFPGYSTEQLRKVLGQTLFRKDQVHKKIGFLSGGEMSRLLLASIMLRGPNVLVFDEPTNHLDLESKEALSAALSSFEGTLLLVSHDRHFFKKIASRYLVLNSEGIDPSFLQ